MPELPEVHTTVTGLQKVLPGLKITDVWTDLAKKNQKIKQFKETLKDEKFFKRFKKEVVGAKVTSVLRRAKNILINLNNGWTILIHLKMTGHLLFGEYTKKRISNLKSQNSKLIQWIPKHAGPLNDPYNRFVHVVFSLSNGKHLVFSDSRKFGKVTLIPTYEIHDTKYLGGIGPEPLEKSFTLQEFKKRLQPASATTSAQSFGEAKKASSRRRIKTVLMDQTVIAGVGNIYSDEMLWLAGIHPLSRVEKVPQAKMGLLFKSMQEVLEKGIDFGGDSMSDYRNIHGERGAFQHKHNVYQLKGEKCKKRGCSGKIERILVGSRSAHYCEKHQILYD